VEPCFWWSEDRWCRHRTRTFHAGSKVRRGPLQHTGTQWMLPSQSWKSVEIGVGGHHRASMLDRNRRVLGIGNQLVGGPGFAAQPFQYVQMVGTGPHDACRGPFHERGHEREGLVERGWWVEDAGVGDNADEAGQNQNGERERFRSRRQAGDPGRIVDVIGDGVLHMCVYQDIHVWKQHLKSPAPVPEAGLVIPRVDRPRPVEGDSRTGLNTAHGDQTKRWRLQCFATLQGIVQRPGNEGAYADASGFGCPAHLLRELVVKRDCGSHDAEHNMSSSTHNTIEHLDTVSVLLTLVRHPERTRDSRQLVFAQSTGKETGKAPMS